MPTVVCSRKLLKVLAMSDNRFANYPTKIADSMKARTSIPLNGRSIAIKDGNILVRNYGARFDEAQYVIINPREYWLPSTPFSSGPVNLASREDLVSIAFEALKAYERRQSPSKSGHKSIVNAFKLFAKIFEFCWLNGLYRLQDWTPEITNKLPRLLGKGGWSLALRVKERVEVLTENNPTIANRYIRKSRTSDGTPHVTNALARDIGSNVYGMELHDARVVLSRIVGFSVEGRRAETAALAKSASEFGMTVSSLRGVLAWINKIADIKGQYSLRYIPFPDYWQLGSKYGRQDGRTGNISPSEIARILEEALLWVEVRSKALFQVMSDLVERLEAYQDEGRTPTYEVAREIFRSSSSLVHLNTLVNLNIDELKPSKAVPRERTMDYQMSKFAAASFSLIALLNARRKDEIIHRKIGLMQSSLEVVDETLGLHQCWFYIEKTLKRHALMYVGRATTQAIERLQEMQRLTARLASCFAGVGDHTDAAEQALFRLPQYLVSEATTGSKWFSVASAGSKGFLVDAIGSKARAIEIAPHMFRRAYGVLFIYRFEGPLLALTQKYKHLDPKDTITYITDLHNVENGPSLRDYSRLTKSQIVDSHAEVQGIENEIAAASRERIIEMVEILISEGSVGIGGFVKLVQRLHQRLASRVDFKSMNSRNQSQHVANLILSRGHQIRPYWHGNCCSPSEAAVKTAPCNPNGGGTRRENAGPIICSTCNYHHLVSDHVASIEEYQAELMRRLGDKTCSMVEQIKINANLENTTKVITLYRNRINNEKK